MASGPVLERLLRGGGGCIFIHSGTARLIPYKINFKMLLSIDKCIHNQVYSLKFAHGEKQLQKVQNLQTWNSITCRKRPAAMNFSSVTGK